MDEKHILAIIRRIDDLERRLIARIEVHDKFRAKLLGGFTVAVFILPLLIDLFKN